MERCTSRMNPHHMQWRHLKSNNNNIPFHTGESSYIRKQKCKYIHHCRLRKTDVYIKFITNTTKDSRQTLYDNLTEMGFVLELEEIHSPLKAANDYVKHHQLKPLYLVSENASQDLPLSYEEEEEEENGEKFDSVVIGLAPKAYTYDTLNKAFKWVVLTLDLSDPEIFNSIIIICSILRSDRKHKLIALNESKYVRRCEGLELGPGFYVKGLEYSADVKAIVIGKPSEQYFRSAIPTNIQTEECVMIGDVRLYWFFIFLWWE